VQSDSVRIELSEREQIKEKEKGISALFITFLRREIMQCVFCSTRVLPQLSYRLLYNIIRMASTSMISAVIKNDHADINKAYEVC
jgi:hypothetical protein